jgi:hypothetical protein
MWNGLRNNVLKKWVTRNVKSHLTHVCSYHTPLQQSAVTASEDTEILLVTTAWRVPRLRMDEVLADIEGSWEYTELPVADSLQGFFRNFIKTFGRTPLDEWSVRRKGLYLHSTTQTRNTNIRASNWTRTHDPSNQAAKTCALDHAAPGTDNVPAATEDESDGEGDSIYEKQERVFNQYPSTAWKFC